MGDHYAFDQAVVVEEGANGGLPVHCVASGVGLDPSEVGIFHEKEEPGSLTEVAEEDVPNDLCRAFTSGSQDLRVSAELENKAILSVDLLLPDATRVGKHSGCGQWIEALNEQ